MTAAVDDALAAGEAAFADRGHAETQVRAGFLDEVRS
jgi:hypothetical protein